MHSRRSTATAARFHTPNFDFNFAARTDVEHVNALGGASAAGNDLTALTKSLTASFLLEEPDEEGDDR